MTQPSSARPVPGPPRAAGTTGDELDRRPATDDPSVPEASAGGREPDQLAGLAQRPVDEHVEVFEAEHDRLQRRLGGIDQV